MIRSPASFISICGRRSFRYISRSGASRLPPAGIICPSILFRSRSTERPTSFLNSASSRSKPTTRPSSSSGERERPTSLTRICFSSSSTLPPGRFSRLARRILETCSKETSLSLMLPGKRRMKRSRLTPPSTRRPATPGIVSRRGLALFSSHSVSSRSPRLLLTSTCITGSSVGSNSRIMGRCTPSGRVTRSSRVPTSSRFRFRLLPQPNSRATMETCSWEREMIFFTPLTGATTSSMGSVTIFKFSWGELPGNKVITARKGGLISGSRSRGVCTSETAPMTKTMSRMVIVATGRRTDRSGRFMLELRLSAAVHLSDQPYLPLCDLCLFYNRTPDHSTNRFLLNLLFPSCKVIIIPGKYGKAGDYAAR